MYSNTLNIAGGKGLPQNLARVGRYTRSKRKSKQDSNHKGKQRNNNNGKSVQQKIEEKEKKLEEINQEIEVLTSKEQHKKELEQKVQTKMEEYTYDMSNPEEKAKFIQLVDSNFDAKKEAEKKMKTELQPLRETMDSIQKTAQEEYHKAMKAAKDIKKSTIENAVNEYRREKQQRLVKIEDYRVVQIALRKYASTEYDAHVQLRKKEQNKQPVPDQVRRKPEADNSNFSLTSKMPSYLRPFKN